MRPKKTTPLLFAAFAAWMLIAFPASVQGQPPPPPVPEGVNALRDLAYVENGHERNKLDLFVPENADGPRPLIIWIHGGGWQNGSKEGCPPLRDGYTQRGYAVASLNYRLSQHAPFPAQLEDCKAAIRWLRTQAKTYNLDPERFGVWGSSAGGHLVALLGTTGDVNDFDVGAHLEFSSAVQCAMDDFGPTDFLQMDAHAGPEARIRHNAPNSPESRLIGGAITSEGNRAKVQRANPVTYVSTGDAPFLINHGDLDPVVPHHQSELLFEALKEAGVPVRFNTVKGGTHGGGFGGVELERMRWDFFALHLQNVENDAAKWPVAMRSSTDALTGAQRAGAAPPSAEKAGPRERASGERPGQMRRGPPPDFDQILSRHDADGDGRVERKEFKGNPALFDRVDRNRDDVMTREEFRAAFP